MSEPSASSVREAERTAQPMLEQLGAERIPDKISLNGVVIAAHPDDEIIGMGARLPRWSHAAVVHVTDGAPNDMRDARALGLASRDEYVALRRAERARAFDLASVSQDRVHDLARTDGEASNDLIGLTADVYGILRVTTPDVVVTHPYEGGHPDHDATAFAVHAAVALLDATGVPTPVIVEMTSYHLEAMSLVTGSFLPASSPMYVTALDKAEQTLKQRMLACHTSQRKVLRQFRHEVEPVRLAPRYDFGAPPHAGPLFYECFPWWTTGVEWRRRARAALRALGLPIFGGLRS